MTTITMRRFKFILIFILVALISFLLGRESKPLMTTIDVTQKLPEELRAAMLQIEPWLQTAQAVRLGKYIIYTPKEKNTYKLRIVTDPDKRFVDIDENAIYIDFNTTIHDSISIRDKDKDHSRRSISYDIFDDQDKIVGNVIDIGRDGQPDHKYMRGDGKGMYVKDKDKYIFVAGQWRNSSIKEKEKGVIIDGQWKKVKFVKNNYELE